MKEQASGQVVEAVMYAQPLTQAPVLDTAEVNFTHSLVKQQVEDGVSIKIENTFGETIFIGCITDILLKKPYNMMVLFP